MRPCMLVYARVKFKHTFTVQKFTLAILIVINYCITYRIKSFTDMEIALRQLILLHPQTLGAIQMLYYYYYY